MRWISKSLNRKFITGTAAGLLVSSFVFLMLFITLYQNELEIERREAATQVNTLFQTSLENAMLKRDLDGLRVIVNRLGAQTNITGVMITNPAGQVRFSNHSNRIGKQLNPLLMNSTVPTTRFVSDEAGLEVLRSINPVHNKPACKECHGPISKNAINGVLFVDYDASSIRQRAQNTTLLLMGSGALVVLINLTGGWWFIRRYILKPVDQLSAASDALSQGALDVRVDMQGSDELANLGATFNRMAENLQTKVLELEESKTFLQQMIDAIPDGVRILDKDYNVLLVNCAYREFYSLSYDRAVSEKCYTSLHKRETPCPSTLITCPLQEINRSLQPLKVIHRHSRSDGSSIDVEIFAAPMMITRNGKPETLVVESIRDLAQKVQFSHQHRLSELGQLATGVAHEIYNPLTAIHLALHASIQAGEQPNTNPEEAREYMHIIDREIDKCINVTERLLKLSTMPASQPELVTVKEVIHEVLSLLKWEAEKFGIELLINIEDEKLRIIATDSEMRMLMLNLAQNAFHAMPNGGKLTVTAIQKEGLIEIDFEDTGIGIQPIDLPKLFYPFFSRRADSVKGSGLGLSICKNIVENYGGTLEVESTVGLGSRFTLRLPDAERLEPDAALLEEEV